MQQVDDLLFFSNGVPDNLQDSSPRLGRDTFNKCFGSSSSYISWSCDYSFLVAKSCFLIEINMSTIKIWYQLVKEDGISMGSADYVELLPSSDIVKFRKQVKAENTNDLASVDAKNLSVYLNKTAYDTVTPLKASQTVSGGDSEESALVVVVPNQTQGIGMRG